MVIDIQATLVKHLEAQHGWKTDRLLPNVVCKHFDTVVGPKQATIRSTFDKDYRQYWLSGEYLSEGRNALAGCFACVPAASDPQAALRAADAFVADVNKAISETYAARLLRQPAADSAHPWP